MGLLRLAREAVRARSLGRRTFTAPGEQIALTLEGDAPVRLDPRAPIRANLPGAAAVVGWSGSGKRTILETVVSGLKAGELGVVLAGAGEGHRWRRAVPYKVDVVRIGVGSRPHLTPASILGPATSGPSRATGLVDLFAAALGTVDGLERDALLLAVREQLDRDDFLFDDPGPRVGWAYRLVAGLDALRRRSARGSKMRRAAVRLARSVCRRAEDPFASIVLGTPPETDEIAYALEHRGGEPRLVVFEVDLLASSYVGLDPPADLANDRRIAAALWPVLLLRILDHLSPPARSGEAPAATDAAPPPFSLLVLPEACRLRLTPFGREVLEWALGRSRSARTGIWLGAARSRELEGLMPLVPTRFFGREGGAGGVDVKTAQALREAGFTVPKALAHRLSHLRPGEFLHTNHLGEAGFVRVGGPTWAAQTRSGGVPVGDSALGDGEAGSCIGYPTPPDPGRRRPKDEEEGP